MNIKNLFQIINIIYLNINKNKILFIIIIDSTIIANFIFLNIIKQIQYKKLDIYYLLIRNININILELVFISTCKEIDFEYLLIKDNIISKFRVILLKIGNIILEFL